MALKFTTSYLEDALSLFRYYKLLAKHFGCDGWRSLSAPRRGSAAFNQDVADGKASQR